jgi:hypothetical protein
MFDKSTAELAKTLDFSIQIEPYFDFWRIYARKE